MLVKRYAARPVPATKLTSDLARVGNGCLTRALVSEPSPLTEKELPDHGTPPETQSKAHGKAKPQQKLPPAQQELRPPKEPLKDPLARVALILVGVDTD